MLLDIEQSGEQDEEHFEEWWVNTDPETVKCLNKKSISNTFSSANFLPAETEDHIALFCFLLF